MPNFELKQDASFKMMLPRPRYGGWWSAMKTVAATDEQIQQDYLPTSTQAVYWKRSTIIVENLHTVCQNCFQHTGGAALEKAFPFVWLPVSTIRKADHDNNCLIVPRQRKVFLIFKSDAHMHIYSQSSRLITNMTSYYCIYTACKFIPKKW